ncbi:hypothetical protein, partial [Thiohalocapsa halophila]
MAAFFGYGKPLWSKLLALMVNAQGPNKQGSIEPILLRTRPDLRTADHPSELRTIEALLPGLSPGD